MKKLIIGMLLALIALTTLLASCGENASDDYAEDLYGSWDKGQDTFEYRADGKIYKNGTVLHRFEVKEEGKIRVYDKTDKELYSTYHFSLDSTGNVLTMNGETYRRTGTYKPDNENDGEAGDVTDKENNDNENDGDYSDGEEDKTDHENNSGILDDAIDDGVTDDGDKNDTDNKNDQTQTQPDKDQNGATDDKDNSILPKMENGEVEDGLLDGVPFNGIR